MSRQSHPDLLVTQRPGVEMKNGIARKLRDLSEQVTKSLGFGGKGLIRFTIGGKSSIEIDLV